MKEYVKNIGVKISVLIGAKDTREKIREYLTTDWGFEDYSVSTVGLYICERKDRHKDFEDAKAELFRSVREIRDTILSGEFGEIRPDRIDMTCYIYDRDDKKRTLYWLENIMDETPTQRS